MARISSYTPEFREEAVQVALQSNKPVSQVAREIDVHPETLRSWVRQYRQGNGGAQNSPQIGIDERARLKELERRNRELEMENSFLKKAAAYFAKDPR